MISTRCSLNFKLNECLKLKYNILNNAPTIGSKRVARLIKLTYKTQYVYMCFMHFVICAVRYLAIIFSIYIYTF